MSNTQPLSKRSKRLLEEASRHLCFAGRGLTRLSIGEYQRLAAYCDLLAVPLGLSDGAASAMYLGTAITAYLVERSHP